VAGPRDIDPDPWLQKFFQHLDTDRGVSPYTQRNYRHALLEFCHWHKVERKQPAWEKLLRDDFRAYVRFLGRNKLGRAAIQLRFCALRTFCKFLVRSGVLAATPIRNLALPKLARRLPKFLTRDQMEALLAAPLKLLPESIAAESGSLSSRERAGVRGKAASETPSVSDSNSASHSLTAVLLCRRDVAILETIYSCGLRISELCGLRVSDIDWSERLMRVRGKGKKERLVPVGATALSAIKQFWALFEQPPGADAPVFFVSDKKRTPVSAREIQLRLKKYLAIAGLDPNLTPHKLRHSYATHMLDAGADLRSVQELLGHQHLVTTQVYTHLTTERLKRAYDAAHPRA